jgi:hypothetical protein
MSARLRLLVAVGLAAVLLAPAAASADYLNFGSWSGYGHSNNNYYNYNRHNGYNNNWRNNWQGFSGWGGYGNNFHNQGRNCHQVKQKVRDNYGNRVVIQSLQCYDRHGYAYIVPGSSQILRWH